MRVLVVRPRDGAERTAVRLRRMGHEPVAAPILDVVATPDPPPPERYDALLLTSAHAVPALGRLPPDGRPPRVFAVGGRTATAAREAGGTAVTDGGGTAAELVRVVVREMPPGAALLHVAGHDRKPEPAASLRAAGFRLAEWVAYEARPAAALPDEAAAALRSGSLEAVLHYSRRSAGLVTSLAAAAGLGPAFRAPAHLCLSADVAAGLPDPKPATILVAAAPDEGSLLALLDPAGAGPAGAGSPAPQWR